LVLRYHESFIVNVVACLARFMRPLRLLASPKVRIGSKTPVLLCRWCTGILCTSGSFALRPLRSTGSLVVQ
jgi:hypothetical protein